MPGSRPAAQVPCTVFLLPGSIFCILPSFHVLPSRPSPFRESLVCIAGFFHREGNAPSQWGQQAYLRFSRRPRSAPTLAAASFRLPRRSSLPVGYQQPWFSWVDLGSVGLPLSSPSHGGPCEASRKLGAVSQTRSGFISKSMQQISSSLLGMVIENHTTNTSDPERLDGRWGKRVTVTLDLCSVSQTVWAPTHDNVLCCMRLYPIKRGCLHPKRSLVPASF